MKKLLLGLIISASMISSCSTGGYKINGKFETDATGLVFLSKIGAKGVEAVDTTRLVDGTFTFSGNVDIPELYLIQFENKKDEPVFLFIENKNIKVSGNTNNLKDVVVKGSKLNENYYKIIKNLPNQDDLEKMEKDFRKAQMEKDQVAINSILADRDIIIDNIKNYFLENIRANSNNPIGAVLTMQAMDFLMIEEFEEIIALLNENLSDHPYTVGLNEQLEAINYQQQIYEQMMMEEHSSLATGDEAPLFSLTDIKGKTVDLKSFRGKYVLIDFWASWCRPCRDENPNLVNAYNRFGGKNFEIISISVDKSIEDWKKAVENDGLKWIQLIDTEGDVTEEYEVKSIPSTWLLDKEGKILKTGLRGEDLISTLSQLLK
jgi:peroxiredoxin